MTDLETFRPLSITRKSMTVTSKEGREEKEIKSCSIVNCIVGHDEIIINGKEDVEFYNGLTVGLSVQHSNEYGDQGTNNNTDRYITLQIMAR